MAETLSTVVQKNALAVMTAVLGNVDAGETLIDISETVRSLNFRIQVGLLQREQAFCPM